MESALVVDGLRKRYGDMTAVDGTALRSVVESQLQESEQPDPLRVWEALDLFASISPDSADWRTLLTDWGLDDNATRRLPASRVASVRDC